MREARQLTLDESWNQPKRWAFAFMKNQNNRDKPWRAVTKFAWLLNIQKHSSPSDKYLHELCILSSSAKLSCSPWVICAVWTDLAKFRHFGKSCSIWQNFKGLFLIKQNAEHTLANLWHYWDNFHCRKWPNIEKQSNRLVTLNMWYGTTVSLPRLTNFTLPIQVFSKLHGSLIT